MFEYLFLTFIFLNSIDILSTYIALKNGGREINFIFNYLFKKMGLLSSLFVVKGLAIAFIFSIHYLQFLAVEHMALVLIAVNVFYLAVVINNILVIKSLSTEKD